MRTSTGTAWRSDLQRISRADWMRHISHIRMTVSWILYDPQATSVRLFAYHNSYEVNRVCSDVTVRSDVYMRFHLEGHSGGSDPGMWTMVVFITLGGLGWRKERFCDKVFVLELGSLGDGFGRSSLFILKWFWCRFRYHFFEKNSRLVY